MPKAWYVGMHFIAVVSFGVFVGGIVNHEMGWGPFVYLLISAVAGAATEI